MSSDAGEVAPAQLIDLFAGPGGLDVAAHWLGLSVKGIEWDENACATRRAAKLDTVPGDVRDFGPELYPNATILAGGPPCQTFSVAGSGVGREALDEVLNFVDRMGAGDQTVKIELKKLRDERTGLVLEPLRWALDAIDIHERPFEVIVLEQVPQVLPVWKRMGKVLESRGYKFDVGVLRTEQFGVPQTRRRAILVAHLNRQPRLPKPTHKMFRKSGVRSAEDTDRLCYLTMGEVLEPGGEFVVVSNYGTGGDPKARGERYSNEPAYTVTGKVSRNKMLSVDEKRNRKYIRHLEPEDAGRLQTFPLKYPWTGKDISQQIGNAIPPRLAAHVLSWAVFDRAPNEAALNAAVNSDWEKYRLGLRAELINEADTHSSELLF